MLYDVVDEMKKASSTTDLTLSIHEKCLAIANREVTQKLIKSILILNETKDSPKKVKLLSILTVDFTLKQFNAYCFSNDYVSLTQQIHYYLCPLSLSVLLFQISDYIFKEAKKIESTGVGLDPLFENAPIRRRRILFIQLSR